MMDEVFCTLKLEDVSEVLELFHSGMGAMIRIGRELYPIISVDEMTREVEVGHPQDITYH